ncbi:MAG TPA: UDP-N-acetylglucosamine 2-epimerase (non-hydrolyzing) [Firmicutes bacterium]|nr:UDP-N-acetylglucosamine 2-epimerase (non-hydrolyzing) [Bacillota bacterium]
MAPVVLECRKVPAWDTKVIVTGQHREMLDQVLDIFQIKADYDLDIMSHGQTLSDITERVLQGMDSVFKEWRPDLVLVHGDTTTAFAAALASFYWQIPVGHVEAGLRTASVANPFPEEANRRLVDVLTTWYFAPTAQSADNLLREGVDGKRIFVTGNTVIDALLSVVDEKYQFQNPILQALDFEQKVLVVTAHRRENWGEPLENICQALLQVSAEHQCQIVVAMHRNPRLRETIIGFLGNDPQIRLIDAPDYREFANLLARCTLLVTDSGGLQEEAPALHKPVLVLRAVTERPEAVRAGTVKLVGCSKEDIVSEVGRLLDAPEVYARMARAVNPYGDGTAAQKIRRILEEKYGTTGE